MVETDLVELIHKIQSFSRNEFVVTFYNNEFPREISDSGEAISGKENILGILTFCRTPRTRQEIAEYLQIKTIYYMMSHYINPLLRTGQLKMTMPEKPKSKNQKYYSGEGMLW